MNDVYQFIVIAHPEPAQKPRIVLTSEGEELARAEAHRQLRLTLRDVQVFDLNSWDCILALTPEPADPA